MLYYLQTSTACLMKCEILSVSFEHKQHEPLTSEYAPAKTLTYKIVHITASASTNAKARSHWHLSGTDL